jgi:ligand-binding SRPBCC domain-containing protein
MRITVESLIPAPPEQVYAALLNPQTHAETSSGNERVVSAPSTLGLGDEVTFEATHFGVRQHLTARITLTDPPFAFEDTMTKGAFRQLHHRHEFHTEEGVCRMIDILEFASPLGSWFDRTILGPYMKRFLVRRGFSLAEHFAGK